MAKRVISPAQIREQMKQLQSQLKDFEEKEVERIGALAVKAGLHETEATDAQLLQVMREMAARFQAAPASHK